MKRIRVTFRRIGSFPSETGEFFVYCLVVTMGIWLHINTLALHHPVFAHVLAVASERSWSMLYLGVGIFGLVSLFLRCFYQVRLLATLLQCLLWLYTTVLIVEVTSDALSIVLFAAVMALSLATMARTIMERPRKPQDPVTASRLSRYREYRAATHGR